MNWEKVAAKLRALSDQHACDAESLSLQSGRHELSMQNQMLSGIFYGLLVAVEAGLTKECPMNRSDRVAPMLGAMAIIIVLCMLLAALSVIALLQ